MTKRFKIVDKMVSPKGEGVFPKHEQISYEVYDTESLTPGNPITAKSSYNAALMHVGERRYFESKKVRNNN